MTTTIKQIEYTPLNYPAPPEGLSTAAAALSPAVVWGRIEQYTAYRFTERDVEWIVSGPGHWHPPLTPTTIATVEYWSSADEWESADLSPSPYGGYWLPCTGPYRFTGTVGGGTVPAAVSEAYRRLAEYMAARPGKAGATSETITAGSVSVGYRRDAAWLAQAMQASGAADLLRTYRRAA